MKLQRLRSNFFNGVWLYGSVALLLLGMALNQPALSTLALLLLVTAGASFLWGHQALNRLGYERQLSANRVFRGESLRLTARLINDKWLPLPWIEVEDQVSDRLRVRQQESLPSSRPGVTVLRTLTSAGPFEQVSWSFQIDCPQRGSFPFGPVTIRSGDLFGFFSRREQMASEERVLVYPRVVPLQALGLPARFPFGATRAQQHLLSDPLRTIGIREYRPEDSFRHIHWKASARLQAPQVKVFEPTVTVHLGIFLNITTHEHYWEGVDVEHAETAISAAASLATYGIENQYLVGVYANGVLAGSDQMLRVYPGLGTNQLTAMMEGLARLTTMSASSFPGLLLDEARRFPWGSTIIVITALMTGALSEALASVLRGGQRVLLLRIGEIEVPALEGLTVYTMPEPWFSTDREEQGPSDGI